MFYLWGLISSSQRKFVEGLMSVYYVLYVIYTELDTHDQIKYNVMQICKKIWKQ